MSNQIKPAELGFIQAMLATADSVEVLPSADKQMWQFSWYKTASTVWAVATKDNDYNFRVESFGFSPLPTNEEVSFS